MAKPNQTKEQLAYVVCQTCGLLHVGPVMLYSGLLILQEKKRIYLSLSTINRIPYGSKEGREGGRQWLPVL